MQIKLWNFWRHHDSNHGETMAQKLANVSITGMKRGKHTQQYYEIETMQLAKKDANWDLIFDHLLR